VAEYYILDTRQNIWWRPNGCGYTRNITEAGKYMEHWVAGHSRETDVCIPCEEVEALIEPNVRTDTEKFVALRERFRKFLPCPRCGGDAYRLEIGMADVRTKVPCKSCAGRGFVPATQSV
jgi:hypothetical protein